MANVCKAEFEKINQDVEAQLTEIQNRARAEVQKKAETLAEEAKKS